MSFLPKQEIDRLYRLVDEHGMIRVLQALDEYHKRIVPPAPARPAAPGQPSYDAVCACGHILTMHVSHQQPPGYGGQCQHRFCVCPIFTLSGDPAHAVRAARDREAFGQNAETGHTRPEPDFALGPEDAGYLPRRKA